MCVACACVSVRASAVVRSVPAGMPQADNRQRRLLVLEGDGVLEVEGESVPVAKGGAQCFVEAGRGAEHRFTAYERLSVVSIFDVGLRETRKRFRVRPDAAKRSRP